MTTTSRQELALHLYYCEGWSYRRIGKALGISHPAVIHLVRRGTKWIIRACEARGVTTLPIVKALTEPSPESSPTRHLGRAMNRQEELLDALAVRLEQRARELAMYEQWIDGDSSGLLPHVKRNPYDAWELRYLQSHKGEPLPTSAYSAKTAAEFCANDRTTCTLGCHGCEGTR